MKTKELDSPDYSSNTIESDDPLGERFYKYGVQPERLPVQRVINHEERGKGVKYYAKNLVMTSYHGKQRMPSILD